ncbi:MAG: valyl-tRNA synthetase [Clostridia bacterium]|jgi:valyl-tRNA synthetase|nr:valyl-tRNA synthetase [Clostridia bacterium]
MSEAKELAKSYDPKQVEDRLYDTWVENGYFTPEVDPDKEPYTIVIPPPNITGQLHMGHALDNTLQDVLIRWRRMQGYSTLWLPGTDHASIATEAKIVEALAKDGISKYDLGRERFLEKAWEWKDLYGGRILTQLKKLGSSCDWSRERFTLDEGCSKAVEDVFIKYYEKGLIYRGERIINWCPTCKTSISDIETIYENRQGNFWHIKYPVKDSKEYLEIATTRPETMLGDTAVAVNPKDERYMHLVGKTLILPLMNKEIPIIADDYVDLEFGTGAVKITPAHDPNDFEVGMRHNLPMPRVLNDDGTINELGGKYQGLDRFEARKAIVKDLEELGLLVKTKDHEHNVGQCQRCATIIEPILSKQWFVKMKSLAEPALKVVRDEEIKFVPERFSKIYFNWMENIQDWCISRQLWWGHRIPAYYCAHCDEVIVAKEKPSKCSKCGGELKQDEDTLDTWFSSALWPFSTLGWPDDTEDLKYFYPTSVLVTGYDIIFFWVARMIFSAMENMNEIPFKHVFIHGMVRDSEGRKMSKSLGNGIDPMDIIEKYGADALRFNLIIGNSPGNDMRLILEKVEACSNFANKIWNASRFVMMNLDSIAVLEADRNTYEQNLTTADKWIISRYNTIVKEVTENLEKFELGVAGQKLYDFIWSEFCDWYIELVKPRLYSDDFDTKLAAQITLVDVLTGTMKLLHPMMPFITEEIYQYLPGTDKSIVISKWPEYDEKRNNPEQESNMEIVMDAIKSIRNIRAEMNVVPSRKAKVLIIATDEKVKKAIEAGSIYFERLASASEVQLINDKNQIPEGAVSVVIAGAEIFLPLEELVDMEKEKERLNKEKENLEKEIQRVRGKLNNQGFVAKAPQSVIEEEKAKEAKYQEMYDKVMERLKSMK